MAEPLILVVTLEVRRAAAADFRQYEREAAAIMADYGGRIERVIEVMDADSPEADTFREIHIVRFNDAPSFEAYRCDLRLVGLAPLREAAIAGTQILRGREGGSY